MNDRLRQSEQPALALPPIRQDLRLYPGSAQQDGSPTWRILDPVRNSFYEIGWLEFELLARWLEHKDAGSLIAHVSAETTLRPVLDEVQELVAFLANQQLLAPRSPEAKQALERRVHTRERAWYEQLGHHYLFFRLPLFRPDGFLSRTVRLTDPFFTRGFFLALAVLFAFDVYLVSREWFSFTAAMGRMLTPHGFVYYALALTFAKIVHEHGHAYAAKRYGVRVPTMGVAFLVLWPYLYTDTSEGWKLADRRKQLVIALAGMAAELALAVVCTFLWALSPEGAARSVFFVLASTTWMMTLAVNVSPFMRFDGYFVLSDFLDFPNLHERSFACARWWMRKTFFGLVESTPEPTLRAGQRAWLIAFAYITWLYRFTVFIGIALLVYRVQAARHPADAGRDRLVRGPAGVERGGVPVASAPRRSGGVAARGRDRCPGRPLRMGRADLVRGQRARHLARRAGARAIRAFRCASNRRAGARAPTSALRPGASHPAGGGPRCAREESGYPGRRRAVGAGAHAGERAAARELPGIARAAGPGASREAGGDRRYRP